MKKRLQLFAGVVIEGLFLVLPLVLAAWLLIKIFTVLQKILHPLLVPLSNINVIGFALKEIIAILVLLLLIIIAGLIARSNPVQLLTHWLEVRVLKLIPGYQFIKGIAQSIAGFEDSHTEILLVKTGEGWKPGFLIEKMEGYATVFLPGAPSMFSGEIWYVPDIRIIHTTISKKQLMNSVKQMGVGSAEFLQPYIAEMKRIDASGLN